MELLVALLNNVLNAVQCCIKVGKSGQEVSKNADLSTLTLASYIFFQKENNKCTIHNIQKAGIIWSISELSRHFVAD